MNVQPSAAASPLIALVGNPNCGKTALFNVLTGSRQKVANYAGVTVERKEGSLTTPSGRRVRILDLPGAYSLDPLTPDEQVTADVLFGRRAGESAAGFRRLRDRCDEFAPEPAVGLELEAARSADGRRAQHDRHRAPQGDRRSMRRRLRAELGVPVVETVGVKPGGGVLIEVLDSRRGARAPRGGRGLAQADGGEIELDHAEVRRISPPSAAIGSTA